MIVTAFHIALNERPLADFPDLMNLQEKNGLKVLEDKSHKKARAEFIDLLAEVIRSGIKNVLSSVCFFSIAMDGSQPRKAGTEKELLYSKVAVRGQTVELLLGCIYVDDFGGDAKSLKRAVDDWCFIKAVLHPRKYSWNFDSMLLRWWCQCQYGQV